MLPLLHSHRSIRAFKPDPLPRELVEAIVVAGQRASTSSNLQTYCVVAVTDAAKRAELAHLCGDQDQIRQAPVFFAWCADLSKLDRACALRGLPHAHENTESFLMSAVDVALVMQNAAVAAESLGLGICYIGGLRNNPRDVIRLLNLPHLVFPICGMTLGWPAAEPLLRPRLPLDAVLHWETHDRSDEDALLHEYDRAMAATGIYDQRQVAVPGRPDEAENYGWLEHSARRVSRPARADLEQVLHEQGFLRKSG
jgi:FMN reductase (NADPH)